MGFVNWVSITYDIGELCRGWLEYMTLRGPRHDQL
jgi:hypothetical protein